MAKRKKTRGPRRKSVEALERGLAQLSNLRMHHAKKVKTLDTKIAAQEGLIEVAKEDEAEAAESSDD
jgi:DNA-binding PadR family transcriptional regulator